MTLRRLPIIVRMMASLMAILLAAPTGGAGQFVYFCTMTGERGPKCGCQHDAEASEPHSSLSAVPCCEVVGANAQLQPTRIEVISPEFETPQFVALPFASAHRLQLSATTSIARSYGARGPSPDIGPPLFIKHCSYLI